MFQNDSAFGREVEMLRESIRQFEQGELDLSPAPESQPQPQSASNEEIDFYLNEAAYGLERVASVVPNEFQGDVADVIAYIEEARRTIQNLDQE